MTKKLFATTALVGLAAIAVFIWASRPAVIEASAVPNYAGDKANGEVLFHAGGCISCHKPAAGGDAADAKLPSGGAPFATPIGTLYPPNITPDPETGIGNWTDAQFVNAVKHGVSPSGEHYIPAFPYTSYAHMSTTDVLDIKAYLMSLKPVKSTAHAADVPLPWLVRRGVGIWKRIALPDAGAADQTYQPDISQTASWNRGAYLVAGAGHCAECHTPRNALLISENEHSLAGGLHPNGKTKVPNLHNLIGRGLFKDAEDLASALTQGEQGGYDNMALGGMSEVTSNLAQLPDRDVKAIAEYLSSLK
jgi:mono/diheme cytochrome c family protein